MLPFPCSAFLNACSLRSNSAAFLASSSSCLRILSILIFCAADCVYVGGGTGACTTGVGVGVGCDVFTAVGIIAAVLFCCNLIVHIILFKIKTFNSNPDLLLCYFVQMDYNLLMSFVFVALFVSHFV